MNELALRSCVDQNYTNYCVYVLDDSELPTERARVDAACALHSGRVTLIRRPEGTAGHKAGNLNNALRILKPETEYVCVVDSDEVLPLEFARETVAIAEADKALGFVQASHSQYGRSPFATQTGDSIDLHWRYFFAARNSRGFVYSFGHGVTFRVAALKRVGGFPEVVAEDVAVSVLLRRVGFRGYFAADIHCLEEAPASYAAFRRRNKKITVGTLEFLQQFYPQFLSCAGVSKTEKIDLLLACLIPLLPAAFVSLLVILGSLSVLAALPDVSVLTQFSTFNSMAIFPRNGLTTLAFATIFAQLVYLVPSFARAPIRTLAFVGRSSALHLSLCLDSLRTSVRWLRTRHSFFHTTGDRGVVIKVGKDERVDRSIGLISLLLACVFGSAFFAAIGLALVLVPRLLRRNLSGPLVSIAVFLPILLTIAGLLGAPGTALASTGLLATFALAHH